MIKKNFWKSGSAEIVAFVLILPFLILPIANTVYMLEDILRYDQIRQAARKAVLRMEIEGGLTSDGLYNVEAFLQSKGLKLDNIHIDYTPYPVDYGREVRAKISCDYKTKRYYIGLGGIKRVDKDETMVYGPISSISKKYER